eukprot:TRINITY_DN8358_c0_g1_i1.p1 TRINITY_DN8358_c0_g1~~TRINITY_DN8358_c0_g1_i1.p1  ORF type:complete len:307 (-),score=38.35 TRINITY_DN8358_c0_g1_i1:51-971(-)
MRGEGNKNTAAQGVPMWDTPFSAKPVWMQWGTIIWQLFWAGFANIGLLVYATVREDIFKEWKQDVPHVATVVAYIFSSVSIVWTAVVMGYILMRQLVYSKSVIIMPPLLTSCAYATTRFAFTYDKDGLYQNDYGFQTCIDIMMMVYVAFSSFSSLMFGVSWSHILELISTIVGDSVDYIELTHSIKGEPNIHLVLSILAFNFIFIVLMTVLPPLLPVLFFRLSPDSEPDECFENGQLIFSLMKILFVHIPLIGMRFGLGIRYNDSSINTVFVTKNLIEIVVLAVNLYSKPIFRNQRDNRSNFDEVV